MNGATCPAASSTCRPARAIHAINHPGAEEIIFVISGNGEQMIEDEHGNPHVREVGPGCNPASFPTAATIRRWNTGDQPMQLFVVHSPVGPDSACAKSGWISHHSQGRQAASFSRELAGTYVACFISTAFGGPPVNGGGEMRPSPARFLPRSGERDHAKRGGGVYAIALPQAWERGAVRRRSFHTPAPFQPPPRSPNIRSRRR